MKGTGVTGRTASSAAVILILLAYGCIGRASDREESLSGGPLAIVHAQVEAFNRHDVEAMVARVAPDFVWFGVMGDETSVEARGRESLAEGMRSYFASFPSARSQIEESTVTGRFVAVRERATWTDRSGTERSQASLGVYEVRDGLIRRVWYYPAEP